MELMGRGFRQIMQESPLYFQILLKFAGYKLFNRRSPLYGSADIINVCNLHCDHCYWWLNRKENEELTVKQVIEEWYDYSNKIGFQFHTPFMKGDPLWLPFGEKRSKVVDDIITMQENGYKDYIIKPRCEECGLGCYSVLIGYGMKG